MLEIFAHAGEHQESTAESVGHAFEAQPLLIALVLLAMVAVPLIIRNVAPEKNNLPFLVLLGELFLVGVLSYSALPILSIICLTIGFMLAFIFVMLGLTKGK